MTERQSGAARDRRAVSSVVALVLIVGVVAVASVGLLLLGANTTTTAKEDGETERIEQGVLELDRDIDAVARSEGAVRRTDLELPDTADAAVREDSTGNIWVNRTNFTTGKTDVLVDRTIGAIRYTRDDGTTYALQAGGVWQGQGRNTAILSPPSFSYELTSEGSEPTLTLPIVSTVGDQRLAGGDVTVRQSKTVSPLNDVAVVENDLVTLKVQSRWYVGWAKYFEQLTGEGSVTVDHANRTATVRLIVPASHPPVKGGLVNGANSGDLTLSNTVASDSYNSSTPGGYGGSGDEETSVYVNGNLTLQNKADVQGDVVVGDEFTIKNTNSYVYGNVSHVGEYDLQKTWSHHIVDDPNEPRWQAPNATFGDRDSIDAIIDLKTQAVRDDNDNGEAGVPINTNDRLTGCGSGGGCTLGPGTYYLEEIDLNGGEELILDTSAGGGGRIDLAVNGTMTLRDADVTVKGDGRVNVYVDSEDPSKRDVLIQQSNVVDDDGGDDARNFWLYMDPDADALLRKSTTRFVGVLYGPGTNSRSGATIEMEQTVLVYGAVVGDVTSISNSAEIHYDESLASAQTVTSGLAIPKLTFLHAAVYEVEVDDDD